LQIIEGWVCIVEAIDANESKDVLGYRVEVLICIVEARDESKNVLGYHVELVIMFDFFSLSLSLSLSLYFSYNVCSYDLCPHIYGKNDIFDCLTHMPVT
jgi:hypothetical protein